MDKIDERRVSVRMPFVSEGVCSVPETGEMYSGLLRDVSITGLFLEMSDRLVVGQRCNIDIVFAGEHSRLKIENVAGSIIRIDKDGVAVRFEERLEWFILIPLYYRKIHNQSQLE